MRLWPSLDSGDKGDLRCFLMDHLLLHYASLPAYLSNKFIKIIVLVGRVAWPHEYPEFFDQMMQVCMGKPNGWCVCVCVCVCVYICLCVYIHMCVCMRSLFVH